MFVSVVYVLQLTLVFIKPARRCRSQHPATYVAVAASQAQAGPTAVGALLEAAGAPDAPHALGCHDRRYREA